MESLANNTACVIKQAMAMVNGIATGATGTQKQQACFANKQKRE
jgi:hypothetical protein